MESLNNWNRFVKLFMIPILVLLSFVVDAVSTDLLMLLSWCCCASELFTKYVIKDSVAGRSNWSVFFSCPASSCRAINICRLSLLGHTTLWDLDFACCSLCLPQNVCVIYLTSHVSPLWPIRHGNSICWRTFAHATLLRPFVLLPGDNVTFLMHLNIDQPSGSQPLQHALCVLM